MTGGNSAGLEQQLGEDLKKLQQRSLQQQRLILMLLQQQSHSHVSHTSKMSVCHIVNSCLKHSLLPQQLNQQQVQTAS